MSKAKQKSQQATEKTAAAAREHPAADRFITTTYFFWAGIALLIIALVARIRLLGIPFERDEGVFTYIGRALWDGQLLYTELYDNKLPGLYLIYGGFANLFGDQPAGIHLGALLWQVATWALFFLWLREILGRNLAMAATGLFALYGASVQVLGFATHATQLCALPAIAGLWALWHCMAPERRRQAGWIFLAGLGAGLAIWIKQQALFYPVFSVLFLLWQFYGKPRTETGLRAIGLVSLYGLGTLLPAGLSAAWFAAQGRFDDFWFWVVEISSGQASGSGAHGAGYFFNFYFPKVINQWWWVWFAGLYSMVGMIRQKNEPNRRALAGLFILSFWGVSLGGAFYPHYFVLCLPWLSVCAVTGLEGLVRKYGAGGWAAVALVFAWPVLANNGYWFRDTYRSVLWKAYDNNPFQEMAEIGAELKKRSAPTDSIAIIGSEPELLLYADRPSALSHLFFQGVVQSHARSAQFQQQTRSQLWNNKPRFVVLPGAQYEFIKDAPLVKEIVARLQKEYHVVCVADLAEQQSKVIWDPPAEQAVPKSLFWVMVMERNQ